VEGCPALLYSTVGAARRVLYAVCGICGLWYVVYVCGGAVEAVCAGYESLANSNGRQLIVRTDVFAMFVMLLMLFRVRVDAPPPARLGHPHPLSSTLPALSPPLARSPSRSHWLTPPRLCLCLCPCNHTSCASTSPRPAPSLRHPSPSPSPSARRRYALLRPQCMAARRA
jgi:hypothetical protein